MLKGFDTFRSPLPPCSKPSAGLEKVGGTSAPFSVGRGDRQAGIGIAFNRQESTGEGQETEIKGHFRSQDLSKVYQIAGDKVILKPVFVVDIIAL